MSTLQFDKIYTRLNTLNERSHDLIQLIQLIKDSPTNSEYEGALTIHQASALLLRYNVAFEETWTQWMDGMQQVAELYAEHAKTGKGGRERGVEGKESGGKEFGFGKLIRRMGSVNSLFGGL